MNKERNSILSTANKELKKKYNNHRKFDKVFNHISHIRQKIIQDKSLDGITILIHSEAHIFGSTRVITHFIDDQNEFCYYSDLFDSKKLELVKENHEFCVVNLAKKFLKEREVNEFLEIDSETSINHPSTYYITVIDFPQNEIIANFIKVEFC